MIIISYFNLYYSPVNWSSRIHQLYLCRGVRLFQQVSWILWWVCKSWKLKLATTHKKLIAKNMVTDILHVKNVLEKKHGCHQHKKNIDSSHEKSCKTKSYMQIFVMGKKLMQTSKKEVALNFFFLLWRSDWLVFSDDTRHDCWVRRYCRRVPLIWY